jgi:hypothetical protein
MLLRSYVIIVAAALVVACAGTPTTPPGDPEPTEAATIAENTASPEPAESTDASSPGDSKPIDTAETDPGPTPPSDDTELSVEAIEPPSPTRPPEPPGPPPRPLDSIEIGGGSKRATVPLSGLARAPSYLAGEIDVDRKPAKVDADAVITEEPADPEPAPERFPSPPAGFIAGGAIEPIGIASSSGVRAAAPEAVRTTVPTRDAPSPAEAARIRAAGEPNAAIVSEPAPPVEAIEPAMLLPEIISVSAPRSVAAGTLIALEAVTERAESVSYDFGSGETPSPRYAYVSFGLKRVRVVASNEAGEVESTVEIAVRGRFAPRLAETTVPHNAAGRPVTTAMITGYGTWDEVRAYVDGSSVYSQNAADRYDVPVPFVGTRSVEIGLFADGRAVSDRVSIELTGTNEPPPKPGYDGPAILSVRAGTTVEFQVLCVDPNGDPLRYEATPLPEGARLDPETGIFSWRPAASQAGYHLVNFYVYDLPFETRTSFAQRTLLVIG